MVEPATLDASRAADWISTPLRWALCQIVPDAPFPFRRRLLRQLCLALSIASLLFMPSPVHAQFDDQQVKAAFVLNFLKFVTWPQAAATPEAPIDVVVLGADDLAKALARASAGQQVAGRAIAVRSVRKAGDIAGTPQLLFIGASERDRLPVLLRQFEGHPVLTVGDANGYGSAGVVLNFYSSDSRIRFEANTTAAARAGLQISSHLLRLARIVG
ncbi:MAG: YfiR family protein [Vicinamibacteraceae bacterium]